MSAREKSVHALVPVGRGQLARRTENEISVAKPRPPSVAIGECHSVRVPRCRGDRRYDHRRRQLFRGVDVMREHQAMASEPVEVVPPPRISEYI